MQAQFKDSRQCLAHSRWLMNTVELVNEAVQISTGKAVCSHCWVNSNFLTTKRDAAQRNPKGEHNVWLYLFLFLVMKHSMT